MVDIATSIDAQCTCPSGRLLGLSILVSLKSDSHVTKSSKWIWVEMMCF